MAKHTPIHYGKVIDGKLKIYDRPHLDSVIDVLNGREVQFIVEERRKHRSIRQNAYLWGFVYTMIGDYCGYTTDEVHDAMKMLFLKKEGKVMTLRSTTTLSTVEMIDYIDKIKQWASQELKIHIPDPDEVAGNTMEGFY